MIHPVIKLIATRPDLLAEHAVGYGALFAAQAGEAAAQLRRNIVYAIVAMVCGGVGVGFAGTALLLVAALPLDGMPAPWALIVIPIVPLGIAAGCLFALKSQPAAWSMDSIKEQLDADRAMWREVTAR
jgi:hypothetical protein